MADTLDAALKQRLRAVLDHEPVTEAELRKLFDEGRAIQLILSARLEHTERRLAELGADPASSLVEIAAGVRAVSELRPDLDELETLLAELQARARESRAGWMSTR